MATTTAPPAPPAPAGERKKPKDGSGSERTTRVLIAILGLATALAGTYGALVTAKAKDVEAHNTRLRGQVSDLSDTKSDLAGQVTDLQTKVDELQAEMDAGPSTTVPDDGVETSPTDPVTQPGSVLRQTGKAPLTFSSGYGVDLDSPAANWGIGAGGAELSFYLSSALRPHLGTPEVSLVDHLPTKPECQNATVRQPNLPDEQARVGTQFCTRTYEGHTAYVRIAGIDTNARTITLDIIVWD